MQLCTYHPIVKDKYLCRNSEIESHNDVITETQLENSMCVVLIIKPHQYTLLNFMYSA